MQSPRNPNANLINKQVTKVYKKEADQHRTRYAKCHLSVVQHTHHSKKVEHVIYTEILSNPSTGITYHTTRHHFKPREQPDSRRERATAALTEATHTSFIMAGSMRAATHIARPPCRFPSNNTYTQLYGRFIDGCSTWPSANTRGGGGHHELILTRGGITHRRPTSPMARTSAR